MRKPIKWILTISVSLNLLFAGFVIGNSDVFRKIMMPPSPEELIALLPEPVASDVKSDIAAVKESRMQAREMMIQERDMLFDLLTAPSFDAAAFEAQMQKMKQMSLNQQQQGFELVIKMASQLSQRDREKLLAFIRRAMPPLQ